MIHRLREILQDSNLNLLIGSGLSVPFFQTLGNIEILLTELESYSAPEDTKNLVRTSLYRKYFEVAINRNLELLEGDSSEGVLKQYERLLKALNSILLRRRSTILGKEINLFTSNIDIFLERALEELGLEFNDGFNGRFSPVFSQSNFKKTRQKKSLHFDNAAELPVFNLVKIHGALTWQLSGGERITFSHNLKLVAEVKALAATATSLIDVPGGATIDQLVATAATKSFDAPAKAFSDAYEKLAIVNPTKEKFKHTLLNQTYYELLRLYANELEKENTTLFALGFSFADEHIREITLRAANSNPTLMIFVVAYNDVARRDIESRFPANLTKNNNIHILRPTRSRPEGEAEEKDDFTYHLSEITSRLFEEPFKKEPPLDQTPATLDDIR